MLTVYEAVAAGGVLSNLYISEGIGTVTELSAVDNGVHRHFFYFLCHLTDLIWFLPYYLG